MSKKDDAEAVAEFIRSKGVTRCPTVCSNPTQATVPPADRTELQRHAEVQDAARRARSPRHKQKAWAEAQETTVDRS
jgi:hypothetical protein